MKFILLINVKFVNNFLHFNISELINTTPAGVYSLFLKARKMFIFQNLSLNEQLVYHAQLS